MTTEELSHVSEKPWSSYTSADYTNEQWHAACLIHQHQGTPTSKGQCKLPVRTPNGALSRDGVHAAAAALAGARTAIIATPGEKAGAAKSLLGLYKELGENAPVSLLKHSATDELPELAHYGKLGMRWGVRKDTPSGGPSDVTVGTKTTKKGATKIVTKGGKAQPPSEDAVKAAIAFQKARSSSTAALSNTELSALNTRMQMELKYSELASKMTPKNPGKDFVVNLAKDEFVKNVVQGQKSPLMKQLDAVLAKNSQAKHRK